MERLARKWFVSGMCFLFVMMICACLPMDASADPGTITVPDDYSTIQGAVNAASPGDTVYVSAGTYVENVNIAKELTLEGEERGTTIIDGGGGANVILVAANGVTVKNLTVTSSGSTDGVMINYANDCVIENINAHNNNIGIYLSDANRCWIKNSHVANNQLGIFTIRGSQNEYSHNYISNNPHNGIQLADTGEHGSNWVHDNKLNENGFSGTDTTAAIFLWGSGSRNNVIENNFCDKNKQGIHFRGWGISGNIIRGNTFQNSTECGVKYTAWAGPDIFYHNNFINNTSDLSGPPLSPNTWDDGYPSGGNYWDTYTGTDDFNGSAQDIPGADGIGDTAYSFGGWGTDNYPLMAPWSLNNPPVADAGGPYEADEGSEITFDASGSSDPDEDELQYRWDFHNDGTWDTDWSADPTATHTWDDDYEGTVMVEVSDGEETDTHTATVTVHNVAPTASIDDVVQPFDDFILPNDELEFYGSFTDPGSDDVHAIEWDFGDGTIVTGTLTPTHSYADHGIYTVALTITDDDGGIGISSVEIEVKSPAGASEVIIESIEEMDLQRGTENSLVSKLESAIESMDKGNDNAAENKLNALINQVEAKRGKKIPDDEADALIDAAQHIIANI